VEILPCKGRFYPVNIAMKTIITFLLTVCLLSFGACTGNDENTGDGQANLPGPDSPVIDAGESHPQIPSVTGCYIRVLSRDTVAASLQQSGDRVTGKLSFDNYQKDGSTGTVDGRIENGVLKILYSFTSEGMNSVMEIRFKVENGQLFRGIGDIIPRGDTVYYSNPAAISFEKQGLEKIDCSDLASKYK
jgi:hypothetical protein